MIKCVPVSFTFSMSTYKCKYRRYFNTFVFFRLKYFYVTRVVYVCPLLLATLRLVWNFQPVLAVHKRTTCLG